MKIRRLKRRRRGGSSLSQNPTPSPAPQPIMADSAAPVSDDLDQLLDSALDDFTKLDLAPAPRTTAVTSGDGTTPGPAPAPVQGLGTGLPDLKAKRKGKQQKAAAAPAKGVNAASEALEQLTRQTREAVRGLESATAGAKGEDGMDGDVSVEDFVKQFEELAGSGQDMESMVQTMMQQLLSKEILYEPMKEIAERYPKWLDYHKNQLPQDDYDRYSHQLELILKLIEVYENDPDNFLKIVDLMQKMQECGQPPNEIVKELAPDLDLSNLGSQLSPEMLGSPSNCCIM